MGRWFMVYRYGSMVYQIEYHFVWVRKYHYKVLKGEIAENGLENWSDRPVSLLKFGLTGVWWAKTMSIFWSMHHWTWRPVKSWDRSKGELRVVCLKSFRIWKSINGGTFLGEWIFFSPQAGRWWRRWSSNIYSIIPNLPRTSLNQKG